ncbi:uncharacterized protein [Phyllobates terribilis]|uniref:uncharacterized protein n=1 Tax=Phyllobates terribilis TaxID=111132 RepID=UPI003CCB6EBE
MAPRVCYVLLLSVLLAAAVSPGRATPVESPNEETLEGEWMVEVEPAETQENLVESKASEENLLTGPQNDTQTKSQPEAENVQTEWTNVNGTQEDDYDEKSQEDQQYEVEEPWWEEEDDWMEADPVAKKPEEDGNYKAEKFWWEAEPKAEMPQWDEKTDDVKPWWLEDGEANKLKEEWERPDMKAEDVKFKPEKVQWWAWPVTMKPLWGAETKAESSRWEADQKDKEPWWEVDTDVKIPQDSEWFPTKKQDEDKVRLDDSDDYEAFDVYIDNRVDTGDVLKEITVQKEVFPPEMKEGTVFDEQSGSVYFWAFLVTLAILVAMLYMVYHKKRLSQQKRFIFALEGGLFGDNKRPSSGEYQKLENKI